VIPAIDVLEGRVVRLRGGRRDAVTIEGGEPRALARRFAAQGAHRLHLVDLDGAFSGRHSLELVRAIVAETRIPLQVGGGYRTHDAIAAALEAGADRVIVGTAALDAAFVSTAVARFDAGLVVAIDAREGDVVVDGWTRGSGLAPGELAARCAKAGVARLLVTSTARDGSLGGPDLALLEEVLSGGLPVIAAGGISSIADLVAVRDLGSEGAVSGSALLRGAFSLADAHAAT
jgi:phosphoribosylformimino-5-aminoimidazole carboxamide ribotide isomerase